MRSVSKKVGGGVQFGEEASEWMALIVQNSFKQRSVCLISKNFRGWSVRLDKSRTFESVHQAFKTGFVIFIC